MYNKGNRDPNNAVFKRFCSCLRSHLQPFSNLCFQPALARTPNSGRNKFPVYHFRPYAFDTFEFSSFYLRGAFYSHSSTETRVHPLKTKCPLEINTVFWAYRFSGSYLVPTCHCWVHNAMGIPYSYFTSFSELVFSSLNYHSSNSGRSAFCTPPKWAFITPW